MRIIFKKIIFGVLILLLFSASYLFIGAPPEAKEITWGVNFSQKQAMFLGLNWREAYLALLDDLKAKDVKLIAYWDLIEPQEDEFYFEDLDWQLKEAENKKAEILLAIGMKTPRWPECHIPEWAKNLTKEEQQKEILELIEAVVQRYGDKKYAGQDYGNSIRGWQVENEPFFPFGDCPWVDKGFLKKEINMVKSLDSQKRPVIISDSGEGSFWITAAGLGDIVGTTLYKKVWFTFRNIPFKNLPLVTKISRSGFYVSYPFPPVFYWRKAKLIEKIFNKKVIVVELQAEPWGPKSLYDLSPEEQEKTMNLERFRNNIEFAIKTGLDEFYLWGAEWWYWLKVKQGDSEIWNEAKKLFSTDLLFLRKIYYLD